MKAIGILAIPPGIFRRAMILLSSICLASVSLASSGSSITLKQALQLTLKENTQLKRYPLAIRAAEAMLIQAELTPNPTIGVEVENAFGSGDYQGFDAAEINLVYSQQIERGGKQQQRLQFANAETQRMQKQYLISRLDILAETSRRYYQCLYIQERIALITQQIQSEKSSLKIINQRAKAGAVGEADVSKMAVRLTRSELTKRQLEGELKLASLRLAAMWMSSSPLNVISGNLRELPDLPTLEDITEAIEQLPSMQYQFALQRLSESRLNLARSMGESDITWGIGIRQHQRTSDQSVSLSLSMPLAYTNPNKGSIEAAQIQVEQSALDSDSQKLQLRLSLIEIQQRLSFLKQQLASLQNQLRPKAIQLLKETEKGFEKGRYSVLQWIDAQSELFSIEESANQIRWQIHTQFLELERITGRSMSAKTISMAGNK